MEAGVEADGEDVRRVGKTLHGTKNGGARPTTSENGLIRSHPCIFHHTQGKIKIENSNYTFEYCIRGRIVFVREYYCVKTLGWAKNGQAEQEERWRR